MASGFLARMEPMEKHNPPFATIYSLLGIRPDSEIVDQTGRPHPLVRGEVIGGILA